MLSSHIARTAYGPISFSNPGTTHVEVSDLQLFRPGSGTKWGANPSQNKTPYFGVCSLTETRPRETATREEQCSTLALSIACCKQFSTLAPSILLQTRVSFHYRTRRESGKGHLKSCIKLFRCKSCKRVHVSLSVRFQKRLENLVSHRRELGCVKIWDVFLERWCK